MISKIDRKTFIGSLDEKTSNERVFFGARKVFRKTYFLITFYFKEFEGQTKLSNKIKLRSNPVGTNSTGPIKYVHLNREIVITVNIYVVKLAFGTSIVE